VCPCSLGAAPAAGFIVAPCAARNVESRAAVFNGRARIEPRAGKIVRAVKQTDEMKCVLAE
jgi:hypothetical protein